MQKKAHHNFHHRVKSLVVNNIIPAEAKDGIGPISIKMIGEQIEYEHANKKTKGIIKDVRLSMAVLVNAKTNKRTSAVQFLIKPISGGRAFWSTSFPNK